MASKKKAKKTYMKGKSYLKDALSKGKRVHFFNPSQRRKNNDLKAHIQEYGELWGRIYFREKYPDLDNIKTD